MLHICFVFIAAITLAAISDKLTDKTRLEAATFIGYYLPVYLAVELIQQIILN